MTISSNDASNDTSNHASNQVPLSCTTAVVLIGGPQTGTRFRPLSFKVPKPLFPIGKSPLIHHHISACAKLQQLKTVFLIGNYNSGDPQISTFLSQARIEFSDLKIVYLQEYTTLGTAGALWHFRDVIKSASGTDSHVFVLNGDVLCKFPLGQMLEKCENTGGNVMLTAKSEMKRQTLGCLVVSEENEQILHFVEKPDDFLPTHISCGVYLLNTSSLFETIETKLTLEETSLEKSIFPELVSNGNFYSSCLESLPGGMHWTQIKSPSSALNANRLILSTAKNNVFIHPTAKIHKNSVIGPNVSIGENCVIDEGVRIKESIILPGCKIDGHSCIVNSIIGWDSKIGSWNHIEGVIEKVNPNMKHSIFESEQNVYFTEDGTMKKIVTIIGHDVTVRDETSVYSCLVLPGKDISYSIKNQIVL